MTVEVTQDELKAILQDSEVQALIISKLKDAKTDGLEESVVKQIAAFFPEEAPVETAPVEYGAQTVAVS